MGFRDFIMEQIAKKRKLAIFDLDDTLIRSPDRPQSHEPLRSWNGKDWWGSKASLTPPDMGGFYTGGINHQVIEAFRASKADPNVYTIMLTGRRGIVAPYVRQILRSYGLYGRRVIGPHNSDERDHHNDTVTSGEDILHPHENHPHAHEEYYSGDHHRTPGYPTIYNEKKKKFVIDSSTLAHKRHVVENLLVQNQGFDVVEFWEDRVEHAEAFRNMGREWIERGLAKQVTIHVVGKTKSPEEQPVIKTITA
jgi:hypothetical protein